MTDQNALHEATYLPEAYKKNSAEARSDPQASLIRAAGGLQAVEMNETGMERKELRYEAL